MEFANVWSSSTRENVDLLSSEFDPSSIAITQSETEHTIFLGTGTASKYKEFFITIMKMSITK